MVLSICKISRVFVRYAGSVDYDNDQGEWVDTLVERDTKIELLVEMKRLLRTRRNSSVFFAVEIDDGKERDITEEVRDDLR